MSIWIWLYVCMYCVSQHITVVCAALVVVYLYFNFSQGICICRSYIDIDKYNNNNLYVSMLAACLANIHIYVLQKRGKLTCEYSCLYIFSFTKTQCDCFITYIWKIHSFVHSISIYYGLSDVFINFHTYYCCCNSYGYTNTKGEININWY